MESMTELGAVFFRGQVSARCGIVIVGLGCLLLTEGAIELSKNVFRTNAPTGGAIAGPCEIFRSRGTSASPRECACRVLLPIVL